MAASTLRRWADTPVFRFLLVGGTNTLATAALVVVLSLVMPGWLAFTISFAAGLIFSVLMTGRWVFKSQPTLLRSAAFVSAYLLIYAVGLGYVALVSLWGGPPWLNGFSVLLTAPLSFLAGKFVFTHPRFRQAAHA